MGIDNFPPSRDNKVMAKDYITAKEARAELGDEAYFTLHRWLVEKGYRNLNDIFVTKDQMQEFIRETAGAAKGSGSTVALWGQTREVIRDKRIGKRKK